MDSNGSGLSVSDVAALSGGGLGGGFGNGFGGLIYLAVIAAMFGGGGWFGNNNTANDALLASALSNNANAIGYENLATSAEVQRGFDNQNNMANQREILAAVTGGTAQTIAASTANATNAINAIKDGNASLIREFGTVETALTALSGKQQECCCDIKQLVQGTAANTDMQIAQSKYDTALGIAGVNSNIAQNKYEAALSTAGINSNIAQNRYEAALNTAAINENTTAQTQKILDAISQNKIESLQAQVNALELQNAIAGVVKYPMSTAYSVPSPCFCGCGM